MTELSHPCGGDGSRERWRRERSERGRRRALLGTDRGRLSIGADSLGRRRERERRDE